MIRHIVLTKFKRGTPEAEIGYIYRGLSELTDRLPSAQGFIGDRSENPEEIDRGYMTGFVIDSESWDAFQTYAENPEHRIRGGRMVENAVGGADGILALDQDTPQC